MAPDQTSHNLLEASGLSERELKNVKSILAEVLREKAVILKVALTNFPLIAVNGVLA